MSEMWVREVRRTCGAHCSVEACRSYIACGPNDTCSDINLLLSFHGQQTHTYATTFQSLLNARQAMAWPTFHVYMCLASVGSIVIYVE